MGPVPGSVPGTDTLFAVMFPPDRTSDAACG